MSENSLSFTIMAFFVALFIFTSILIITERPLSGQTDQALDEWVDIVWYIVITMTTIGYGDKTAKTLPSGAIVLVVVVWGNFWISILLGSIIPFIQ